MHVCFVSYWGLNEGLTQATVIPHLKILLEHREVEKITFITVERKGRVEPLAMENVAHRSLITSEAISRKLFDKGKAKKLLEEINSEQQVDVVFSRSSLAGWLVMDFCKSKNLPLIVESFEPHADYMLEAEVWKKLDPRYVMAKSAEKRLKRQARFLLPVTRRYAEWMVKNEEVDPSKILVMPCCVDADQFAFREDDRNKVRSELGIGSRAMVGVYTGKLGGIYLEYEALVLFQSAFKYWGDDFHLIILSPDEGKWRDQLSSAGISTERASVLFVQMSEVPRYLSASDVAFSLHKPGPSKMGISPIKNGEYFASGLPIIIPEGIGDDSSEVTKWDLGVTISMKDIESQAVYNRISPLLEDKGTRKRIAEWAKQKRSFNIVRKHYATVIDQVKR